MTFEIITNGSSFSIIFFKGKSIECKKKVIHPETYIYI